MEMAPERLARLAGIQGMKGIFANYGRTHVTTAENTLTEVGGIPVFRAINGGPPGGYNWTPLSRRAAEFYMINEIKRWTKTNGRDSSTCSWPTGSRIWKCWKTSPRAWGRSTSRCAQTKWSCCITSTRICGPKVVEIWVNTESNPVLASSSDGTHLRLGGPGIFDPLEELVSGRI